MRENVNKMKCNITVSIHVNVLSELDNITNKDLSRNKLVNEAILNYLKQKYKISFLLG